MRSPPLRDPIVERDHLILSDADLREIAMNGMAAVGAND
jgi:hypothetical protein